MSPAFFIRIVGSDLVLWDYKRHRQYEIGLPHLSRILDLTRGEQVTDSQIDLDIINSKIMDDADPSEWGWDCLSRIFHVGTQVVNSAGFDGGSITSSSAEYLAFCESLSDKIPELLIERVGPRLPLPHPSNTKNNKPFIDVLMERQTCRAFTGKPLTIDEVSTALWLTFGNVHGNDRNDLQALGLAPVGYRKTSPSGGSLHPSEPYVIIINVTGVPSGIYHYAGHKHELTRLGNEVRPQELARLLCQQDFASDLAFGIFISTRFDKMWWKYPHSRAYRVALLDIGCLIQTFQMVCASLDVQSWPTGYFLDQEVNSLLGLNESIESSMFFLGGGIGEGAVDRETLNLVMQRNK
ncbi:MULTISPECIES: SagB/ThcOx family dehydrogenase [Pseudomonas syringae group]|uniref:Nitroreductase domain-containing protein n=1 Tax=Pseudomonas syringae pv. coryli TaxID=317659 RepID=A0A0P9N207_9PSED|nr:MULTISPECIES: SagB/ThcOx family dehydrogenase [Pseudomonas syringae group]KPW91284.1 Uncharacterized protein ALO75_00289 [Pseudomonas syringae pv. coryli]POP65137.1 hypothetical protein CXB35_25155 [Pseudomonas syringae]